MATVGRITAEEIMAGKYKSDGWKRITKYTNAWGGESFGLENNLKRHLYTPSEFVIDPVVIWENGVVL